MELSGGCQTGVTSEFFIFSILMEGGNWGMPCLVNSQGGKPYVSFGKKREIFWLKELEALFKANKMTFLNNSATYH